MKSVGFEEGLQCGDASATQIASLLIVILNTGKLNKEKVALQHSADGAWLQLLLDGIE